MFLPPTPGPNPFMPVTAVRLLSPFVEAVVPETTSNPRPRCVVRLRTSTWFDGKALHLKKSLTILRKQCVGYNVLQEDASNIGAEDVISKIIDLDSLDDGIYEVVACNESRDWESGHVEDYDYRLVPFPPEPVKMSPEAILARKRLLNEAYGPLGNTPKVVPTDTPRCCVCGTEENLRKDGWYGYRCNSPECVCY